MKQFSLRSKTRVLLLIIIILTAGLRLYRINQIPHGLYWDEAAITYNAWGIAEWNRDEHGVKLPLSFKSFGDYKAPLLIYILGATYKLTGLQISYLRIFIAICGIINVFLIYGISRLFKPKNKLFIITSTVLMAITPWAIHFSRIGVEVQLALTLILLGIYAALRAQRNWNWLFVTITCFALSLYAYHSTKIFIPLLILLSILFIKKKTNHPPKPLLIGTTVLFITLILPFLYDAILGSGFERGKTLILFTNGQITPAIQIITVLLSNISSYIKPSFWIQNIDAIGLRHGVPGHGVLFISVTILAIIGVIRSLVSSSSHQYFLVGWLIIGISPAILSYDNPHAIRGMLALPAIVMLAASSICWIFRNLQSKSKTFSILFLSFISIIIFIELVSYINAYYGIYARQSATEFQYGYQEAIITAQKLSSSKDKIIVTTTYGQPYIYTLLYRHLTPEEFKFGALANYEFRSITWPEDNQADHIYVATPEEIPISDPNIIHQINIPNTQIPVFVIAQT